MDIRMPGVDGIEATRRIAAAGSPTRVLVLTTFDHDEYVFDAFRAGASGFLVKDAPREQIVAGIRAVAAGEALASPSVTRRLIERLADAPGTGAEAAARARRADPARARGARGRGARAVERGARRAVRPQREDRQDARLVDPA